MVVEGTGASGITDMTFMTGKSNIARAMRVLADVLADVQHGEPLTDSEIANSDVVGVGMCSHADVATGIFRTLLD